MKFDPKSVTIFELRPDEVFANDTDKITGLERIETKFSGDLTKLKGKTASAVANVMLKLYKDGGVPELAVIRTRVELKSKQVAAYPPISQMHCAFASFAEVKKFIPKIFICPVA